MNDALKTGEIPISVSGMSCRFCGTALQHTFVDLGMSPLCESFLRKDQLNHMEPFYPLHVYVCEACFLVQLGEYVSPQEIFSEYAYFSSYSDSWVRHAERYAEMVIERFGLGPDNRVVEIASNDGYLLQHFKSRGIPCLGIEPAVNVARVAIKQGIPTIQDFFGTQTARRLAAERGQADLLVGNNVFAHVPALNDFTEGLREMLKPNGVLTLEFPHLVRLIEGNQFDTIYHEHFSYLSLASAERVLAAHRLRVFDVEELKSHGGSLRLFVCHENDDSKPVAARVGELRAKEVSFGLTGLDVYSSFGDKVQETKRRLLEFLIRAKQADKSVVGYGAPGKGNTLLNYCGIRTDFLDYTVDRNTYKHGRYTPGTHIPIYSPDEIARTKPDYILILPWNLQREVVAQLDYVKDWGGRFFVPIPEVAEV